MKKIVVINASPRYGANTAQLLKAASAGVSENGDIVEFANLYELDKYSGCISCFACKRVDSFGRCVHRDALSSVLEKIRTANGLIIGSPIYLGNLTSSFRALYERLVFQSLTYNKNVPCCNKHKIPVLLIVTSNCSEDMYEKTGYKALIDDYKRTLDSFVGPTKILICGNTLQVDDYSKYDWTMFNIEEKKKYHEETFDDYKLKVYELSKELLK